MPTKMSTIVGRVRIKLQETTARFWTDAEILEECNACVKDLWRAINMTHQNYWLKVEENLMTIVANTSVVAGVPADMTTLKGIEVTDEDSNLKFVYKDYNHPDFVAARASEAIDIEATDNIYVAVVNRGAPVGAPTIYIAPQVSSALTLRVSYIPTEPDLTLYDDNPIPGESDKAIRDWAISHCMAKINDETKAPNAEWLALYSTEKQNILEFLLPRHDMDPICVEAVFEREWGGLGS